MVIFHVKFKYHVVILLSDKNMTGGVKYDR